MDQFDASALKKIGVYTSGGDAPGMNAAIRAVVRNALAHQIEVTGIYHGYRGWVDGHFQEMTPGSVANIVQRGGTILKSGRCQEFLQTKYRKIAAEKFFAAGLDAAVCIGGDGSLRGAEALWKEHNIPIVGVPGTIDNDINGSENTIGFDTAVNPALNAIDRVRDTAASHDRLFIVEVMGRNSGFLATHVGLAGGAEAIFIPENLTSIDQAVDQIQHGIQRGKLSSILVAAEGQKVGRAYDLAEAMRKKAGFEARVCVLGHVQRGGPPTASDRVLASQMGATAVDLLKQGHCNVMVGWKGHQMVRVNFETAIKERTFSEGHLHHLAQILAQ